MQQRIYTHGYRPANTRGFQSINPVGPEVDHPERMLFYAMLGGVISWSVIGAFVWAGFKLFG